MKREEATYDSEETVSAEEMDLNLANPMLIQQNLVFQKTKLYLKLMTTAKDKKLSV